jgi:uncharacterized membrane protein
MTDDQQEQPAEDLATLIDELVNYNVAQQLQPIRNELAALRAQVWQLTQLHNTKPKARR